MKGALKYLTAQEDTSTNNYIGQYWVPLVTGHSLDWEKRCAILRAIGFLSMLVILRNNTPPLPVSPHLLWILMDGPGSVHYDNDFVKAVDGRSATNIASVVNNWDGSSEVLRSSGSHAILRQQLIDAGIDVCTSLRSLMEPH